MGMTKDKLASILVVEDVSNIRELLNVTLRFKGYSVRTAANGQEALAMIAADPPALVISDILMPKMDGFSLVQRIRLEQKTRNIPIIMISATYVSAEDRSFALRLGAVRFLEKPVDTDVFLLAVEECLAAGKPALPDPLEDRDFYAGYVTRLEVKLAQKENQITRAERLLLSLEEDQKRTFKAVLEEEIHFRNTIMNELATVKARVLETGVQPLFRGEA